MKRVLLVAKGLGVVLLGCDLDWRAQLQAGQQIALGALYAVLPCTHAVR